MDPGRFLPDNSEDQEKFLLFTCLAIDLIGKIQNKLVFKGLPFVLEDSVRDFFSKWDEFAAFLGDSLPCQPFAIKSLMGVIKINIDAIIRHGVATLTMVARNWLSAVFRLFVFKERINVLAAAEALAILKATIVTRSEW